MKDKLIQIFGTKYERTIKQEDNLISTILSISLIISAAIIFTISYYIIF